MVSLERFLYALGIRHVGAQTARALAQHFGTLKHVMQATEAELASINDIGEVVAASVREYFSQKANQQLIEQLRKNGVTITKQRTVAGTKLAGQTFVITGTLPDYSRDQIKTMIEAAGGSVTASVSSKTNYLVAGDKPGSKLAKAQKLNVIVLDQVGFLAFAWHIKQYSI